MRESLGSDGIGVMGLGSTPGGVSPGSPLDPVFSRYTRYAATTRVNIDDFGDWSRYTEPLQALHPR
jgi:hypothetical protein